MMKECDTLLMVGSGFPYSEFLPEGGPGARRADRHRARHAVAALSDGGQPGRRRGGDAARAAAAAAAESRRRVAQRDREQRRRLVEDAGGARDAPAEPVNPQRVTWELSPRLPDGVDHHQRFRFLRQLVCARSENTPRHDGSLSGGLASMGAAVPYAIAAKFAHPDRPVIALVGDGAMQMNNMAELITVAKYWRRWSDHRWIVCVFNNEDLNQVTWEQRVMEGDPKFNASQQIPNVPYHKFAELIGLEGHLRRPSRTRWARHGTRRSRPTGRSCWRSRPIRKCRRCRRTSPSSRRSISP